MLSLVRYVWGSVIESLMQIVKEGKSGKNFSEKYLGTHLNMWGCKLIFPQAAEKLRFFFSFHHHRATRFQIAAKKIKHPWQMSSYSPASMAGKSLNWHGHLESMGKSWSFQWWIQRLNMVKSPTNMELSGQIIELQRRL